MLKGIPVYKVEDGSHSLLPFYLPAKRKGHYEVKIDTVPAGETLPVVSIRNALFMGLPVQHMVTAVPLQIHKLNHIGHGTWMTSMPQEIEQHTRQLAAAHGRVLVGGLGLGLAVHLLAGMEDVVEVVVVERQFEVLELVGRHVAKRNVRFVQADLFRYLTHLEETEQRFDCAFYDIWAPTGSSLLEEYTLPLRRLSKDVVPNQNIQCWNEDEMIGQVVFDCRTILTFLEQAPDFIGAEALYCDEDRFQRLKKSMGPKWYFLHYLRREKPKLELALDRLDDFAAALKDPAKLQKDWYE